MQLLDITDQISEVVERSGVAEGICHVFVEHTTAGVTINEGADPDVAHDIETELGKLDARRFWARLEANGHRIDAAYGPILERPAEHPYTAFVVRELLSGLGRVEQALKLDQIGEFQLCGLPFDANLGRPCT